MEMYKSLNKELVDTIQSMKESIRAYREEILYLSAKNIEEKSLSNRLQQKCIAMAKEHFRQYLDFLDPTSPLLEELSTAAANLPNRSRQSSRLAEEARRSSSIMQNRLSLNSMSPVRTSTSEDDDDNVEVEGQDTSNRTTNALQRQTTTGIVEEDENGDEALEYRIDKNYESNPNSSMEVSLNLMSPSRGDPATPVSIQTAEETEEATNDDETHPQMHLNTMMDITADLTSLSVSESPTKIVQEHMDESNENDEAVDENSENEGDSNNGISRRTLRDVTNTRVQSPPEASQSLNNSQVKKRQTGKRIDEILRDASNVNLNRNKRIHQKRQEVVDPPHKDVKRNTSAKNESSFDGVRHSSRLQKNNETSFTLSNQDTSASSFTLADITMDQFRAESSSTPNNKNTLDDNSSRPKRKCKPKSLAEPRLGTKLRNDSKEQSLGSKNRTKTNK